MSHLFADYYRERLGCETIEVKGGFIVFQVRGTDCFVQELYVTPDARLGKLGSRLMEMVSDQAKDRGCKTLSGTIFAAANGAHDTLHAALHNGMKLQGAKDGCIWVSKEI